MREPQEDELMGRLRAFVRGEVSEEERNALELLIDGDSEVQAMLGVLARSGERQGQSTESPRGGLKDPRIGQEVGGRYLIRRRLGSGGMGHVYEAQHAGLGRAVAIKLLRPAAAEHTELRRRFEGEARAAASLRHENIVEVYDVGRTQDGVPFVVYELLNGPDLQALVAAGALSIRRAAHVAMSICDALGYAHRHGVVHRDVKPANIVFADADAKGAAKLVDFGISKIAGSQETRSHIFMGTPGYAPPEQMRNAKDVDASADVYGLGMTLRFMTTGQHPAPIGPYDCSGVPKPFDSLVRRCIASERAQRPTIGELRQSLKEPAAARENATPARRLVLAVLGEGERSAPELFGEGAWEESAVKAAWSRARELERDGGVVVLGPAYVDAAGALVAETEIRGALQEARHLHVEGILVAEAVRALLPVAVAETVLPGFVRVTESAMSVDSVFAGRAQETALLFAALDSLDEDAEGQRIQVTGPPGIGKTRLLEEAAKYAARQGIPVRRASHLEQRELLGQLMSLDASPPASAFEETVDPRIRRDRRRAEFFQALRSGGKALIVVDDGDQLQAEDHGVVDSLAEESGVLVIVASRKAKENTPAHELRLKPLPAAESRRLVDSVAALVDFGDSIDDAARDVLVAVSGGNPLFIEQLVRVHHMQGTSLPAGIEGAVRAHLDGLREEEGRLGRVLSILGTAPFDAAWLEGFEGCSKDKLRTLQREGLLRREGALIRFRSEVLARAAAASLGEGEEAALHRGLAGTLVRNAAPPRLIYTHFRGAGDTDAALGWGVKAFLELYRDGDFDRAMPLGQELRDEGARSPELYAALADMAELRGNLSLERELLEDAMAAQGSADGSSTFGRRCDWLVRLAVVDFRQGLVRRALERFNAALELAESPHERARCLGKSAVALAFSGQVQEGVRRCDEMERIVMIGAPEMRAEAAMWRSQVVAAMGDLADRRNAYWVSRELFTQRGDLRRAAGASVSLADTYNRLGAYDEAAVALRDALRDSAELGYYGAEYARVNLAYALLHLGEVAEAQTQLARAEAAGRQDPQLEGLRALYGLRCRLHSLAEDTAARSMLVKDAIQLARAEGALEHIRVRALALGAEASADLDEALLLSEEALTRLSVLGSVEEDEAEIWLARVQALERAGRLREMNEVRAAARALVLAKAHRIGDPMWRDCFLRSVPAHTALLA